ncbi:hypothetical protein AYI82_06290 [Shewanella algae]|uniref:hypothetical protein n=1 Tax=Shewanella algae TaxID=38313 RepID=UPI001182A7A3|nr:hypothetical protein [Shewanella algae]TVL10624.1 hypothetical protein AYI82_06290 [Shewanella algae]
MTSLTPSEQVARDGARSLHKSLVPCFWFRWSLGLGINTGDIESASEIDQSLVLALAEGGKALGKLYSRDVEQPTDDIIAQAKAICSEIESTLSRWRGSTKPEARPVAVPAVPLFDFWLAWYGWSVPAGGSEGDWFYRRAESLLKHVDGNGFPAPMFPGHMFVISRITDAARRLRRSKNEQL